MKIIYLHGFNSAGNSNSEKIQKLESIGEVIFINYDSFIDYNSLKKNIRQQVLDVYLNTDEDIILCGTSLGGFWAAEISKDTGIPAILINPAVNPRETLSKHLGIKMSNHVTGEINILQPSVVTSYPTIPESGYFLVLLDEGDNVIDAFKTEKYFKKNTVHVFKNGSHRFEHMTQAIPFIEKWYNRLLTTI